MEETRLRQDLNKAREREKEEKRRVGIICDVILTRQVFQIKVFRYFPLKRAFSHDTP